MSVFVSAVGCTASKPAPSKVGYGMPAAEVAQHVAGCSEIRSEPTADPTVYTMASCMHTGLPVEFAVWASAEAKRRNLVNVMAGGGGREVVAVVGDGWTATVDVSAGYVPLRSNHLLRRRVAAAIAKDLHGVVRIH